LIVAEMEPPEASMVLAEMAPDERVDSLKLVVVNTHVVWNERPATAILNDASVHGADLIAQHAAAVGGSDWLWEA
jgi:hypothetical protein